MTGELPLLGLHGLDRLEFRAECRDILAEVSAGFAVRTRAEHAALLSMYLSLVVDPALVDLPVFWLGCRDEGFTGEERDRLVQDLDYFDRGANIDGPLHYPDGKPDSSYSRMLVIDRFATPMPRTMRAKADRPLLGADAAMLADGSRIMLAMTRRDPSTAYLGFPRGCARCVILGREGRDNRLLRPAHVPGNRKRVLVSAWLALGEYWHRRMQPGMPATWENLVLGAAKWLLEAKK